MIKKKKKKNRILITLCAMFLAVASVFAFIPFTRNDTKVVKADTVDTSYQFTSSDTYHFDAYLYGNGTKTAIPVVFSASIKYNNGTLSFAPFYHYVNVQSWGTDTLDYLNCIYFQDHFNNIIYEANGQFLPLSYGITRYFTNTTIEDLTSRFNYFVFDVFVSDNFNCNVYKVNIEIVEDNFVNGDIDNVSYLNFTYYDNNDNYLIFSFAVPSNFVYQSRTYYLISPDALTNNQYYNQGYQNGYTAGETAGYDSGNSTGYNNGYNTGYNNGYTAGLEDTNQYTFLNLISATIDAPIKYFQSLFNFELLGVNLQGFLTGLFTLCVIVTIIKMVL